MLKPETILSYSNYSLFWLICGMIITIIMFMLYRCGSVIDALGGGSRWEVVKSVHLGLISVMAVSTSHHLAPVPTPSPLYQHKVCMITLISNDCSSHEERLLDREPYTYLIIILIM